MYNYDPRSSYQEGGAAQGPQAPNSRMNIYNMLKEQGIIGDMPYEQFAQLPPQQLNQLMEQVRQSQSQPQGQPEMGGPQQMPQMSLGSRVPMPLDSNQVRHLTQPNHTWRDTHMYGSRTKMYYGGMDDNEATGQTTATQPNLEPIYGDDPTLGAAEPNMNKGQGLSKQAGQGLAGMGLTAAGGLLGNMGDSRESATTARNKASTIGSSAAQGAASGMAFGPWGALAGAGIGAVMGGIDSVNAEAAEQDQLREANKATNVGALGSSLAAYGKRTSPADSRYPSGPFNPVSPTSMADKIALAERIEVERRKRNPRSRYSGKLGTGGIRNAGSRRVTPFFNDANAKMKFGGNAYTGSAGY
jgi:hypothetical protein